MYKMLKYKTCHQVNKIMKYKKNNVQKGVWYCSGIIKIIWIGTVQTSFCLLLTDQRRFKN